MKFIIKGKMPGMNKLVNTNRTNKYAGAKLKKDLTDKVYWTIKAAGCKPAEDPTDIEIEYYEPNKRRDPDNILTAIKFILDGMVKAEILKNDGWKNIRSIREDWKLDRKNPRIEVKYKENK